MHMQNASENKESHSPSQLHPDSDSERFSHRPPKKRKVNLLHTACRVVLSKWGVCCVTRSSPCLIIARTDRLCWVQTSSHEANEGIQYKGIYYRCTCMFMLYNPVP